MKLVNSGGNAFTELDQEKNEREIRHLLENGWKVVQTEPPADTEPPAGAEPPSEKKSPKKDQKSTARK